MGFCYYVYYFILLFRFHVNAESWKVDLSSEKKWTLTNERNDIHLFGIKLPSGVYTELERARVLMPSLYYRFNDLKYRWVSLQNWTYSTTFLLQDYDFIKNQSIILDTYGIDTVSTISINGITIGHTHNMFRRHQFYLPKFSPDFILKSGNTSNELRIEIMSPVLYANQRSEKFMVAPVCVPAEYHGECHVNQIRKMQASFGWDWGPAFPSVGIWKPMYLIGFNSLFIKHIKWFTQMGLYNYNGSKFWQVELQVIFQLASAAQLYEKLTGKLQISLDGIVDLEFDVILLPMFTEKGGRSYEEASCSVRFSVPASLVKLWWPNGFGIQTLYELKVSMSLYNMPTTLTSRTIKVAFRSVQLVQDVLSDGMSFYFRINGIDMFMKGSNWIPAHVLPERVSETQIYHLLVSAKEANMNMLRVWGGGIYEQDTFYEFADQLGILIWQDFMFACSMYPAEKDDLENVALEITHQVRRLQFHASIVLWSGNNENEAALSGNWYNTDPKFIKYKNDYIKLYVDTIQNIVKFEDKSRTYLVSSPSNGKQSEIDGYIAVDPNNGFYGDIHFYNYVDDNWDPQIYPQSRFISEYGFQSFSSYDVIQNVTESWDRNLYSDFISGRQHHKDGNLQLTWQVNLHMDLPLLHTESGFKKFIYLVQIYQAVSLKTATEKFRRDRGNSIHTMGTLYWQFNEIWPGVSWSSLDYGGILSRSTYITSSSFVLTPPIRRLEDGTLLCQRHVLSSSSISIYNNGKNC